MGPIWAYRITDEGLNTGTAERVAIMPAGHSLPSSERIREFVIAAHGDLGKVKQIANESPELVNTAYPWSETDSETAIQAAAQMGNAPIAEYLLEKGAPLEICTAAMLGRRDEVSSLLEEKPDRISAKGAHGIPLLTHAAWSSNMELVQFLYEKGARAGVTSALHNAVRKGNYDISKWLLENAKPDLRWKDFQGKTALEVAVEHRREDIARLLRENGAAE